MKALKEYLKKFPNRHQWKVFFRLLSPKETVVFFIFFSLVIASASWLNIHYYLTHTEIVPAIGGEFTEGVVGQPRFINPLYLSDNDVDRDLVELLFSGLLRYDRDGKIIPDLAADYTVDENEKVFEFQLRDNLYWSDGQPLTVDDVVFTVNIVQSPQYKSPQRIEWLGVNVEKIDSRKVVFRLQKSYSAFLETIARLKIIPEHVFKNISPETFPWILTSKEYLVGSGPYRVDEIRKDKTSYIQEIVLTANKYSLRKSFIERINFVFFKTEKDLVAASRSGRVDGLVVSQPEVFQELKKEGFKDYQLSFPRYFALFFNFRNSALLKDAKIRKAIDLAINKKKILERVFDGYGEIVRSPILADFYGLSDGSSTAEVEYNITKAMEMLASQGFKRNSQTGLLEKTYKKEISKIFKRDLEKGVQGDDVKKLQECLAKMPDVYPEGEVTGYFGTKTKQAVIRFQEKYADDILKPLGLKKGTGKVGGMTRDKLEEICQETPTQTIVLQFTITTIADFPLLEIAQEIKRQLEAIGIGVKLKEASLAEFQTRVLEERNFEALVFGEALGMIPDPFPFWHSSQRDYPGLNLTGLNSKKIDSLVEKLRETPDPEKRQKYLREVEQELKDILPAVFLVRPSYFYLLSSRIKGFGVKRITDISKRFVDVNHWYIKTKRVEKR